MNLLVAGGAGFIGSHFARMALEKWTDARVIVFDALTYAGNLDNLKDLWAHPRFAFHAGKVQDCAAVEGTIRAEGITHVVNFAAESHNDRSLLDPGAFIQTDVFGVFVLLEAVRRHGVERLVHVSTDEVYGSIDDGQFTEQSPLEPNTPYSASKAGGDLLCRAFRVSFDAPVIVTRGGNTYGPYQYPEKLIPFFVTRLIEGKKVPLYGDGNQVRQWIHARDHAAGVMAALEHGELGEVYNVADSNERSNREVVRVLLEGTGRGEELVKPIPDPRGAAHDKRYSMDGQKLRALGWRPEMPFEESLRETVRWYLANEGWWRPIAEDPKYREFVRQYYGPSLGDDL